MADQTAREDAGRAEDGNAADGHTGSEQARGPIAWMARNGVAANLLMLLILASGVVASQTMVQEVFPGFSLDRIQVQVLYPGAAPEEIEDAILRRVEQEIESVEGIKEITATAQEGRGIVMAELTLGSDPSRALDDVKAQVDRISEFPAGAERPEVTELTNRQSAIRLALSGGVDERSLKRLAYRLEDELSALPEISYVETGMVRRDEISIEIPRERLRALGLSLPELAQRVRAGSLELSAGSVETDERVVRVRTLGRNLTEQEFQDVVVVTGENGAMLRLGDIARVRDTFEDVDRYTAFDGKPVAFVEVFRTADERVLDVVGAANRHIENEFRPSLPEGVRLDVWEDRADSFSSRLRLLGKNGAIGFLLVLVALTLFLDLRVAFWVAAGISVAFVGALAVMALMGASINQMSLFAFILALGIVVDDAIVVGENVHAQRHRCDSGVQAAIAGTQRIARPVIFAVLTTMAAFVPLLFVPGILGKILLDIPIVVIAILALSLIESLLILPNHLSHLPREQPSGSGITARMHKVQQQVDGALKRFVDGPLERALRFATGTPSVVIAAAVALIIVTLSLIPAGILRIEFFPSIQGDVVSASLEMPEGTSLERTREVAERIAEAGRQVGADLDERHPERPPLLQHVYLQAGQQSGDAGPGGSATSRGQNLAQVQLRLLDADEREVAAREFESEWRQAVGDLPEARSLSFASDIISAGSDVEFELSHPDADTLARMSERLRDELARMDGVFDVQSDRDYGTGDCGRRHAGWG